jgi:hypothetical protein
MSRFPPGSRFSRDTVSARSPSIRVAFHRSGPWRVLEATNFGMLFTRSAKPMGSLMVGHTVASPSYVFRPSSRASAAWS